MKRFACVFACVAFAAQVEAQTLTIHHHPQKAVYNSPAEWPPAVSGQVHWGSLGVNDMFDPADPLNLAKPPAHLHVDLQGPMYAEIDGHTTLTIPFVVTLFHCQCHVGQVYPQYFKDTPASDIVWDATGTSVMPPAVGDPMGIVTFAGHFVLPPPKVVVHGWTAIVMPTIVGFDNGDAVTSTSAIPVYSMVNPSAPEVYGFPALSAMTTAGSKRHPERNYGQQTSQYGTYMPVMPVSVPWRVLGSTYGYGSDNGGPVTTQQRLDLDLHHLIPGTILSSTDKPANQNQDLVNVSVAFDASTGTHKYAFMRFQNNGDESITTLLVVPLTFDPSAPAIGNPPFEDAAPPMGTTPAPPMASPPAPTPTPGHRPPTASSP